MSRKFNTKKFIKDVLNDRYALVIGNEIILDTKIEPSKHQQTAIQSVAEMLLWPSFDAAKEMAGSSHTPASCLSKPRSSQGAGKKQPRVWLQYVCGVKEVFFYPSFGAPLVFLRSPYGDSVDAWYIHGGYMGVTQWCYGNLTEVNVSDNLCSLINDGSFVASRAFVQKRSTTTGSCLDMLKRCHYFTIKIGVK